MALPADPSMQNIVITIGTVWACARRRAFCDDDTAFRRLRTLSRHCNRKAREVAEEMVHNFAR